MKKLAIAAVAIACASIVSAQTATSQNIVGYTKVTANGGELVLVTINFDDASASISSLMSTASPALPDASKVYVWSKSAQDYLATSTFSSRSGLWSPDHPLARGDAFWIAPEGAAAHELIFSGEVNTADDIVVLAAGATAMGYGYPVSKDFRTTEIADAMAPDANTYIYRWDAGIQDYLGTQKTGRGGWGVSAINLDPTTGFWLVSDVGATATNTVPFTP